MQGHGYGGDAEFPGLFEEPMKSLEHPFLPGNGLLIHIMDNGKKPYGRALADDDAAGSPGLGMLKLHHHSDGMHGFMGFAGFGAHDKECILFQADPLDREGRGGGRGCHDLEVICLESSMEAALQKPQMGSSAG
jgi:hypothetical protein